MSAHVNGVANGNGALFARTAHKFDVVLGAQWGDEGKGKLVDHLAQHMDIVARSAGGNNAGHTIVANGKTYDFHMLPSGIVHKSCTAVIGNGVVLNLTALWEEVGHNGIDVDDPDWHKRLVISSQSHLLLPIHQLVDARQEKARVAGQKIGTTGRGIGPCYADKARRGGIRVADLMADWAMFEQKFRALIEYHASSDVQEATIDVEAELATCQEHRRRLHAHAMVVDTPQYLHNALTGGRSILVEGANGVLLDIDFGTYPYVTSSNSSVGGVVTGLGMSPMHIGRCIGIVKAYQTRVGAGPFPTEQEDEQMSADTAGGRLRKIGGEFGVTTGRARRCGWLDLVQLRRAALINSFNEFALTKMDVLDTFAELPVCVAYKLDGVVLECPPTAASELSRVECVYETQPGWTATTAHVRAFDDLPAAARDYVHVIEKYTNVYVRYIGVGQDRLALIDRGPLAQ